MIYLFALLIIVALCNLLPLYLLLKEKRFRKKLCASWKQERENFIRTTDAQRRELQKQRELMREMQNGWFPATYENCRRKYGASIKVIGSYNYPSVNYFTMYGVVLKNGNTLEYKDLLIKLF